MSSYLALNELTTLPHGADTLRDFYEARRVALGERIRHKLSSGIAASAVVEDAEEYDGTKLDAALDE